MTALLLAACGRPAARLQHARDLALAGHHKTALLEARAILLTLRDEQGEKVDAVRRGALKLAGDLCAVYLDDPRCAAVEYREDRKSTRLNSSHLGISYAVFCLKK